MKSPALFKEYLWLVNTIYKAKKITLQELNEKWLRTEMSGGVEFVRSTFNRRKTAVEEMFGINIECDRRDGYRYYISNVDVLDQNSVQLWMMSMMSMGTMMKESFALKDRILVENTNTDEAYLLDLLHAMKQGVCLDIVYQRYGCTQRNHFTIAPYCLKMFHRRWYVLGRFDNGNYGIFALDRIKDINKTDRTFELDPEFDAEGYFCECYGVMVSDETPCERVVVRVMGNSRYYLRDLPLHHSQAEVCKTDEYTELVFNVRPTTDFMGELLYYGPCVKVIEPQWLADNIKNIIKRTLAIYEE